MAIFPLSRGHIEKIGGIFVDFCGRSDYAGLTGLRQKVKLKIRL